MGQQPEQLRAETGSGKPQPVRREWPPCADEAGHKGGGKMQRLQLKVFRVSNGLTQQEMADKLGCTRSRYVGIEAGRRDGGQDFWEALQKAFEIENEKMWELMNKEEKKK